MNGKNGVKLWNNRIRNLFQLKRILLIFFGINQDRFYPINQYGNINYNSRVRSFPSHSLGFIFLKGLSITDKVKKVRSKMSEYQVDHLIIHRTDDVACKSYFIWSSFLLIIRIGLFNLRGGDIPFNPVFLSFALLSNNSIRFELRDFPLDTNERFFLR